jgi:hypothetical protein
MFIRGCHTSLENGEWLCDAQEVFFILHSSPVEEKEFSPFSILQSPRMGPPPFKESVPSPHSPFFENRKKEV